MRRWAYFIYGVVSHALFFGVFAYLAGFVGNFAVPKSIDSAAGGPISIAIAIDILLMGLFAAQHSIMARPEFKRIWTRIVPEPIERSTYVLAACMVTVLLMWQWRGIDLVVWDVRQPFFRRSLWGLFAIGWLWVPLTSVLINHFDLFGTRQVWLHLQGR
ncbi:MAG TPA: isoprenylcysteine carboxylmethyltransferase family protein, partial [Lacipirellulaceae bacterium]|nr:isoprenylcysteine carboxylmethyltransferase family protein [Lacipirellulaceae bacterium]